MFIGAPLEYGEAKEILKEIRAVIPGYGSLGPSPIPPAVDPAAVDRYVHEGYRRDLATRYTLPARAVRPEGTVQLGAGPEPVPFRETVDPFEGTAADRTERVLADESRGCRPMCHRHGDRVRLSNSRGEFTTTVKVLDRVPEGLAWLPDHFRAGRHATL